ncbi:MAG: SGNH/GDSL hydrolase family protein [Acidimicrobiales bacterium]
MITTPVLGASSQTKSPEKSYVIDYVGSYEAHTENFWIGVDGSGKTPDSKGSISFTFALGELVTPTGSLTGLADKVQTSLRLSGTIKGSFLGPGASSPCSGALSATTDAQGDAALVFDSPHKGDITASTTMPEASMIASMYHGLNSLCEYANGEELDSDPGLVPVSTPAVQKVINPSLTLKPGEKRGVQVFSASATKGTNGETLSGVLTVEPAPSYVALGDSFSAGDSMSSYDSDAHCWRSSDAYPVDYSPSVLFLACSGASPAEILANQVPLIPSATRLVTITAGGDDPNINLFLVLGQCILDVDSHFGFSTCQNHMSAGLRDGDAFVTLRQTLVDLFHAVHHQAPHAKLYVLGYPNPIPNQISSSGCPGLAPKETPAWVLLADHDLPTLQGLVRKLNAVIQSAAGGAAGTFYVQPFSGQDVCSAESAFFPMSVTEVGAGIAPAPLHPDAVGQHEMATLLRKAAGPPP